MKLRTKLQTAPLPPPCPARRDFFCPVVVTETLRNSSLPHFPELPFQTPGDPWMILAELLQARHSHGLRRNPWKLAVLLCSICPPCAPSGGHRAVTPVTPSLHPSLAKQKSWQCSETSSLSRVRHLCHAVSCFSSFVFFAVLAALNCWGVPYQRDYSPVRSAGHQQWLRVWSSPLSHLQGDYKHFILPLFFFFFFLVLELIYFAYISPW